jgi:hypothetical protein
MPGEACVSRMGAEVHSLTRRRRSIGMFFLKVFGCRPRRTMPQALAAGVRKPPREETAIWARWPGRVGRHPQLWGFELWADAVRARCPSRGLYSLNPSRWGMNGMCSQGIRAASKCTSAGSRPRAKPSFGSPESQKLGSKNRATSMTSRQMKDSGLPGSSKYRRDSVNRHQFDGEAGTTLPRPRDAWPVQRKPTKPPSVS